MPIDMVFGVFDVGGSMVLMEDAIVEFNSCLSNLDIILIVYYKSMPLTCEIRY